MPVVIDPTIPGQIVPEPPETPHFDYPFTFYSVNGQITAGTVEQDSLEDITACVGVLVNCPIGACQSDPTFGIPSPQFARAPIDPTAIQRAVGLWEPRASVSVISSLDTNSIGSAELQLQVSSVHQDG